MEAWVSEEPIIYEDETSLLKVVGVTPGSECGYRVRVSLENKTKDRSITVEMEPFINGIHVKDFVFEEAEPGQSVEFVVDMADRMSLRRLGLVDETHLELMYELDDRDEGSDVIGKGFYSMYPRGKENAEKYAHQERKGDVVVLDDEHVKLTLVGYEKGYLGSVQLHYFMENKTDQLLNLRFYNLRVNGKQPVMGETDKIVDLYPERSTYGTLLFSERGLKEIGISEVTDITFSLAFDDQNNDTHTWVKDYKIEVPFR